MLPAPSDPGPIDGQPAADFYSASKCGKTPEEVLRDLRFTCRLITLHPWIGKGSELPDSESCEPIDVQDLLRLIKELANVIKVICQHREHVNLHRDAYLQLLSQIVATLKSPAAEDRLLDLIGQVDLDSIEFELGDLRRLVINSARSECSDNSLLTVR